MHRSKLPAKLSRPRLSSAVERERLFALIEAHRERALLWITGPPGAGKTTLVSTYLANTRVATLWYRVDAGDGDIPTFFSFLAQGARSLRRKLNLPLLTPEYLLDLPGFTRRFFRALFDALPAFATVVLDNYENAPEGTLDGLLAIAIEEAPPGMRLIVTSRTKPPPALAHLTAKGTLASIPAEEMRLSIDEARAIATDTPGAIPASVDSLHELCDGWTAGFVVMLENARRSPAARRQTAGMPHEPLFQYFANEMFSHADEATREVLIRTALLPVFSEIQARTLCPQTNTGPILQHLYHRHYFITRGPGPDPLFRYHTLFRDFLLQQGITLLSRVERQELQAHAAALLAADGLGEDAVALYIEAAAWHDAARLLCEVAPSLLAHGRNAWIDKHISALPQSMLDEIPWLGYWLGMARLPIAPSAARSLLEAAYARMDDMGDTPGRLLCCAGVLDTFWLEWVDVKPLDHWGAIVESVVATGDAFLDDDLRIRILSASPGLGFRAQAHSRLIHLVIDQSFNLLDRIEDPSKRLVLANVIGWLVLNTGDWRRFQGLFDAEDAGFLDSELPPMHLISWYIVRCATVWISGGFEKAERELLRAQTLADQSGVHVFDALIAGHGAYYAIGARSPDRADAAIAKMRRALNPSRKLDVAHYESLRAAAALLRGDATLALRHAHKATALAVACGSDLAEAYCRTGAAMALISLGLTTEASQEVASVFSFSARTGIAFFRYNALMLRASMLYSAGDRSAALDALREGLSFARKHDFLVCGLLYPQILDTLCPIALQADIETDYVCGLIRKLKIPAPAAEIAAWPWPVRIHTLGCFAIEVNGAPVEFGRKAPRRLLQLIKWLVAQGGQASAKAAIDALWPDEEADAALNALDAALHRVRKLLGGAATVEFADGTLRLDRESIHVDAFAFEHALENADDDPGRVPIALATYRGHFLPDEAGVAWAISMHERLRARFILAAVAHGRALEAAQAFEPAASHYARAIDIDDLTEALYQGLMRCQLSLDLRSEGIATYDRLQRTLDAHRGIKPATTSDTLLRALRRT